MKSISPVLLAALEKGTGTPIMRMGLYKYSPGTWTQIGEYNVLEAILAREFYDIHVAENLLDTGLVDSVVNSGFAVDIVRGLEIAGTEYTLASNLYYISSITYSAHEGRTHLIADLLPTTALVGIDGTQTARQVIDAAMLQFNNLLSVTYDTNRDIWFDWQFYDTDKELNLIDGRTLASVLQQKYFAYFFPRWFHLLYVYGVASNEDNNLDGTYTPFAHARTTYFLYPDKPINLTWDSETGYQEYIDVVSNGVTSLGFISDADDPSALSKFQKWSRIFNGYCLQYVQRPDMRLEQGDILKVSTDGFDKTRCFEQIEIFKSRNAYAKQDSPAAWYQIVKQLPYHPEYNITNIPIPWWQLRIDGGGSGGIGGGAMSGKAGYVTDPTIIKVMSSSFTGVLSMDASNVQQAFELLDKHAHDADYSAIDHDHDADYAPVAEGVTNGDAHDHAGGDGAQIDHGGLAGLSDDDHTQYIKHALATAASDFLAASGSGAFVKKTKAETQVILNVDKNVIQILLNTATALVAGNDAARIRIPAKLNGLNLTGVAASRQSGTGVPSIMIRNVTDSQDMLSTAITIDSGETDSSTAATPAVINTSYDDVATGDQLAIDVDAAGTDTLSCVVELTFS